MCLFQTHKCYSTLFEASVYYASAIHLVYVVQGATGDRHYFVGALGVTEAHMSSTQLTATPVPGAHARLVRECLGHTTPSSGGPGAASPTPFMKVCRVMTYECCMIA